MNFYWVVWILQSALSSFAIGGTHKTILCDDKKPQVVHIKFGRITVIDFPFKPKDVIPGDLVFDFKQMKNDLVIKALRPGSKTNILVYLEGRRCAFELITSPIRGDDIIVVKDPKDSQYEVTPR